MLEAKSIETTFHIFDLMFAPYKGEETTLDSERILREVMQNINDNITKSHRAILIDRNQGKKDSLSRNLFIRSAAYSYTDKKWKCKISLLREDKLPDIVNKQDFTPMDLLGDHVIAETTNFCIDLSRGHPIVCFEFNSHGPRIADLEFYLRHISNKRLQISKKCQVSLHFKLPINEVLGSITEVLKFDIKVRPNMLKYIYPDVSDAFVTNMTGLSGTLDPNYIRVESFFRESGQKNKDGKKNNKPVSVVKRFLTAIAKDEKMIENFEDFSIEFEDSAGDEHVFNLLKGKEEIVILTEGIKGRANSKELYQKLVVQFDEYLVRKYTQ